MSPRTCSRSAAFRSLMKALLDGGYLHGDCMTVTGKTIAENLADVVFPTDQDVIRPTSDPITADRRRRRPQGNLRPRAPS